MDINYKTIYLFGISLSAIILLSTLTNKITTLNFGATVFATIAIIVYGLVTWIIDIYLDHKADEEEASQYWDVWFYHPFKEIKDKKRANLIAFIIVVSLIILFSWLFVWLRRV